MKSVLRNNALLIGFFVFCIQSYAQNASDQVIAGMTDAGAFSMVERSDWRRYDNGKYTGLVRSEVRASIVSYDVHNINNDLKLFHGNYFVLQSTLRDMRQSAQAVDAIIPVSYEITDTGSIEIEDDCGFPMMRGFPYFPNQWVSIGVKWRAPGNRAVDPLNTGEAAVIPFIAEYEYRGIEYYNGAPVHRIYATYGYNYRNIAEMHSYAQVTGNHKVDVLIRVADKLPVFMRDDLAVKYTLGDKSTVEFKGFTLTFYTDLLPIDREAVITSLENTLKIKPPVVVMPEHEDNNKIPVITETDDKALFPVNTEGLQNIELTPVPEGIKLTIKDIRFIADAPQFLPEERPRLDLLAEALKQIPNRTFLVEGHTASTGQPAGEMQLSIERAKSIIDELVKRGINADRFIYKGWGGTKPVGDNTTNTGRTANRRVEITILE
ncbi:MAG: OmpA family protein [Treponema sp.]|nr:OmpA family protein [Treponema sp.]MCL2271502.1 OmpA family protein [Treponema sp.]